MGEVKAVDFRSQESLWTYSEVLNFMSTTYATNEVVADAYAEVTNYAQLSAMSHTAIRSIPLEQSTPLQRRVIGQTSEIHFYR